MLKQKKSANREADALLLQKHFQDCREAKEARGKIDSDYNADRGFLPHGLSPRSRGHGTKRFRVRVGQNR